jgi:urate oxidase
VLESDIAHAYLEGSNAGMTPTDTQKNTVYYIAKRLRHNASPEDFAIAIARHFVGTYPKVSKAKVSVSQAPWQRHVSGAQPHQHAFVHNSSGTRTAYAELNQSGALDVHGGLKEWKLLKTTQSGYEGM